MIKVKNKFCLITAVLLCFILLVSCTDDGDTSGSAVSNGVISNDNEDIISDIIEESDIMDDESLDISDDESVDISDVSVGDDLSELNAFPMTFEKVSEVLYKMECVAPDGNTLFLTFDKKPWGTYNIGTWTVADENSRINLAGGGTDWEYVYRSGETDKEWDWSGGNHGNELLVDITFYNGESEKELDLQAGTPVELNNLKIVENTKLHWGDTSNTYCDVTRTYTVVGNQIKLDVAYKYTKDCYHWLSYTCMFPVDKKYGLYIAFVNPDNDVIKTVETLKVGAADYSGPMHNDNAADRCVMWGYVNPKYKFDVSVKTVADSCDNFKNAEKTFYWDMNATTNKLYYSKYDSNKPTLVPSGTEYNTTSMWTFYVD